MRIVLFITTVISLICVQNLAAQINAEDLLSTLQKKFDSIEDLSAKITQNINGKNNLSGTLYFKKENKIRFELKNQTIISDGISSWKYNVKEKKVIISDYEADANSLLSINYLVYDFPKECDLALSENDNSKALVLIPRSNRNGISKVELWINNENLISKALISDQNTGAIEILFSNYKLNQNISDSKFTFTPPEGSTVIDLR